MVGGWVSEGNVQSGFVFGFELLGCGGVGVGLVYIMQELVINVRVNNIKAARVHSIFLDIFTIAYYNIDILAVKKLRLDLRVK